LFAPPAFVLIWYPSKLAWLLLSLLGAGYDRVLSLLPMILILSQHCQRLVPEYSKAALGLHPLLPLYAVDCDEDKNKRLCSEQGVKGFPTIKVIMAACRTKPDTC
jgi:protein disulfide-isomerase A6